MIPFKASSFWVASAGAATVIAGIPALASATTTASPSPVHEWVFTTAANGATSIADTGSAGTAAYAGTISLANVINNGSSGGYLQSSNVSGSGMYIPNSVLSGLGSTYTIEDYVSISPLNGKSGDGFDAFWGWGNSSTAWTAGYSSFNNSNNGGIVQHDSAATPNDVNTFARGPDYPYGPIDLIAATYDGTNINFYVNGNLAKTVTQTGFSMNDVATAISSGAGGGIGFDPFTADGGTAGNTYDFRIYNSTLSQSQIQADFAAGPTGYVAPAAPTPSPSPAPLHEWNFSNNAISGGTVPDSGTAGSSATAGSLTGGATVSNGQLVTNNVKGQGMSIPVAALSSITGSFSIEDIATSTTANQGWSTLFNLGSNKATSIFSHPERQDSLYMSGEVGYNQLDYVGGHMPVGTPTMETLTWNATTDTFSLFINGVLQGSAVLSGSNAINLASITSTGTNLGIGGFDPYNDPSFTGGTSDFRIYGSALTPGQVLSDYQTLVPVPAPATLAMLAAGCLGMLLVRRNRVHN